MFEGIYIFLWDNKISFISVLKNWDIIYQSKYIIFAVPTFSSFQSLILYRNITKNTYYFQSRNGAKQIYASPESI